MFTGAILGVFLGLLYIAGRYVRRFLAWGTGNEALIPKEKVVFALPIFVAAGFVVGWLFEPAIAQTINQALVCSDRAMLNVPCLLGLR